MSEKSPEAKSEALQRAIQWATLVLLVATCVLLIYATITLRRYNQLLERISDDLAETLATTAKVSRQVDKISLRVESFGGKLAGAVKVDEIESVLGEIASVRASRRESGETRVALSPEARSEMGHLMSQVARCDGHFEAEGKTYSPRRMYLQLLAKKRVYEDSLTSTEDFIERVAARSMSGKEYFVAFGDGTRKSVAEWLREELEKRRAGGQ